MPGRGVRDAQLTKEELSVIGRAGRTQFETLAGFSAVIDRLGEFTEVVDDCTAAPQGAADKKPGPESAKPEQEQPEDKRSVPLEGLPQLVTQGAEAQGPVLVEVGIPLVAGNGTSNGSSNGSSNGVGEKVDAIVLVDVPRNGTPGPRKEEPLLLLDNVTLRTPDNATTLVESLNLQVRVLLAARNGPFLRTIVRVPLRHRACEHSVGSLHSLQKCAAARACAYAESAEDREGGSFLCR